MHTNIYFLIINTLTLVRVFLLLSDSVPVVSRLSDDLFLNLFNFFLVFHLRWKQSGLTNTRNVVTCFLMLFTMFNTCRHKIRFFTIFCHDYLLEGLWQINWFIFHSLLIHFLIELYFYQDTSICSNTCEQTNHHHSILKFNWTFLLLLLFLFVRTCDVWTDVK